MPFFVQKINDKGYKVMIRKLVFALSLLGACFTGLVHALGLGEATVKSSLNQPLTAEIELVSVGELGIDEVLPGLATREEFLRAKVDRVYFLSDIRFEVIENEKGNLAVVLTTTKPVREPFLNFIVEIIWPSGRLLREYALLIDPPLYSKEKASPVQAPVASQSAGDTRLVNQSNSGDQLNIAGPAKTSVSAINTTGQNGGTYGATTRNDTLWDIAIKARPNRSVTPQQVMLSIQDLNPKAFISENINKLKAGQVLRLPTLEQVKERTSNQAIIEVIVQNEAIRPKRTRSVASAAKQLSPTVSQPADSNEDELKLVVGSNQANAANTANSGSSTQAGNGRAESNEEMMLALEKLDKADLENTELNGRVTDLEEQLQTLQRILALKNDQLANVQGEMRANELAANNDAAETESGQTPLKSTADEQALLGQTESAGPAKAAEEPKAELAKAKEVVKPVPDAQPSDPVSAKTENFVQIILNSPLYIGLLCVGIIVLLAVLWLVSRNNALKEEEYYAQNTDDDGADDEQFGVDDDEAEAFDEDSDNVADDDSSLVENDFALADEGGDSDLYYDLDSDEEERESEDVIAEADVYIAYGRLDQAANILENAISDDPVRTDYRLKLLEVYKDSNDTESFNRQFSELEAIQDSSANEEAVQIRTALLESELVSLENKEQALSESRNLEEELESKLEQGAAIEAEVAALESDTKSFDFDSVDEASDAALEVDFSSDELELDLDVDLDFAQEDELLAAEADDLALETTDLEVADLEADDKKTDDQIDIKAVEELDTSLSEGADILDIDLDDIDLSAELDQETEIALSEELPEEGLSLEGITETEQVAVSVVDTEEVISDEILDEAVEAFSGPDELADNLGDTDDFDFLDGTDEASTKLDLARAYIDMGDVDGAKDILGEVAKEGSEEQQAEANDLLGSLDV
ncbi:MAG: pilus assembly protein FimV [Pseudohongiellaceae bacterium]|jgi:pilus assembly protein FimV